MWGEGGRLYWGTREEERRTRAADGIVVIFAWLSSQERSLKPFIDLYSSLGWISLVCHSDFLTLFSPEKATSLACGILNELVKEVKIRPLPIVFVAFSVGPKGCLYKVLQLMEGKCEGQLSLNVGPILIFCSEDDELAPYPIVSNFAQRVEELGGEVRLVKWNSSPHVGHYKHHPAEYKTAVTEFLVKAAFLYTQRRRSPMEETAGMAGSSHKICKSVCCLQKAAVSSNESLRRVAIDPSDHFFLPSSAEHHETKEGGSLVNEQRGGGSFQMQSPPTINANGVLGQILFDVCVPKNIEGWDIKPVSSSHRHGPFNPIKCLRRSRL